MSSDISSYRNWRFELDQAGIAQLTERYWTSLTGC